MSDERDEAKGKKAIQKPQANHGADFGRRVVKAAGGALPVVGSAVAEYFDAKLPNPTTDDRVRWEGEVTDNVNDLNSRVDGISAGGVATETVGGATAAIAQHMIERCPTGRGLDIVDRADLDAAFPNYSADEIADALGDLEFHGLLDVEKYLSGKRRYSLNQRAYEQLDRQIMGWDTEADARMLAGIAAKNRYTVMVPDLEKEVGWPRRRLNPALRKVLGFISPGRIAGERNADYVARQFFMDEGERAALRRFAAGK